MTEIVSVEAVTRRFPLNHDRTRNLVSALTDASLQVEAGEFLAIAGPDPAELDWLHQSSDQRARGD
jgi:ABC-type oligopeptide transport system ATPase subunit